MCWVNFACTVVNTPVKEGLCLDCKGIQQRKTYLVKGKGHG